MADCGTVYLIGAGPGDPGLLTLRGRACIAQADVVVYDYLANPVLLDHARADAERMYVGKRAGHHSMKQEEITGLLVRLGRRGRTVARLKGGDPFVFGRGGEEALALAAAGVAFEVVPGVTAAVAAPAYAGIPVTHRTCNSVLSLVTGHEDPTKADSAIDWAALAAGGGTLAFYMGVRNLPRIVDHLTRHGRAPSTPVALIRCGTMPVQTVVSGTLADIVDKVARAALKPPALILVGDVVSLRDRLRWFDNRPLFGRTAVVTRSRTQASEFARRLELRGARVLQLPTIAIAEPDDRAPLEAVVRDLAATTDWVLFTSVNGVDHFFSALDRCGLDTRQLGACRVGAIGPGTAERLRRHGVRADLVPPRFTSKAFFQALLDAGVVNGTRFLLPRADIAPRELVDNLAAAGAQVTAVTAYRTLAGTPDDAVIEAFADGTVDVVTFTSSSTARNFAAVMRQRTGGVPGDVAYVSIGPETTRAARAEGLSVTLEADPHTIPGLVEAVTAMLARREGTTKHAKHAKNRRKD